jgi:hypothetical protein
VNGRDRTMRWVPWLVGLVLIVGASTIAYNAGVSQGVAQSGRVGAMPPYGWHPWGWYHPFGFLFPFFFFAFWFFVARLFFWGGPWRRRWYGHPYEGAVPPMFEEWHRRAHEASHDASSTSKS